MEVRNCRGCGRLYNYIGGTYLLCPACMDELEEKFKHVKDFIKDNPKANMHEIAEANDVSTKQIERWVREERLFFADDSPIGISCEGCGTMIKSGRLCPNCKDNMSRTLGHMYNENIPAPKKNGGPNDRGPRMRFLNN